MTNNNKLKITNMRNVYLSIGVIIISIAGMLHTYFGGGWSKSTGEAAKLYPRLVYAILFVVSLILLIRELSGKVPFEPPALTIVKWWQVPVVLVATSVFFLFSLYVGTAVGILLFLIGMMCLFDEDFKKNWKKDLLVAVCATGVLWVIFTFVLPIITKNQILI